MAMRLLVEGLDWAVNEGRLSEVFSAFGELSEARVAMDWETGRSRGFGWVTFVESTDAEAAMAGLDGQKLAGKTLRVMVAPEQTPRPSFRSADYGYTNAPPSPSGFRNADFDEPGQRPPRTDRRLFRSADFGYVERPEPPAEPAPRPDSKLAGEAAPAPRPAVARPKTAQPPVLDDDDAANRARYGGWDERDDNDGGRGGGSGGPFG
jgi:RNA recognition motif-containing protein